MHIFLKYLRANWLYSVVLLYMAVSCLLKLASGVDVTIPCLFTTIFGYHCPGCGLTTATIDLLKFDLYSAWKHNPLIFLVLPAGSFYIVSHFLKYKRKTADIAFSK